MLGELGGDQIERVLHSEVVGRIGCHDAGRPYVVPITYAYDGDAIYGHTSEGQKLHMMRANPYVCFEVEQVDDLANWRSVIAWGVFEELTGEQEQRALRLFEGRARGTSSETPVVYRIVLREKTGRFEKR